MSGVLRCAFVAFELVALLTTVAIAPASAQSEADRASARALATQGLSAYGGGRFTEALDLFTRAESLLHAPPHVLYLGRSAAKLGQLVRAREVLLKLVREELPANAPQAFRDAQNDARTDAQAIEAKLASVVITVKAPQGVTPSVELDGKPVSVAVLGVPIPADPGKHLLKVSAPGHQEQTLELTFTEAGKSKAELQLVPTNVTPVPPPAVVAPTATPAPAEATSTAPVAPAPAPLDHPPAWMRPVSYVAFGVGAIGLGAGVYFGLDSRSKRNDADSAFDACKKTSGGCDDTDVETKKIDDLDNQARTSMTVSIVGIAAGVVGLGAGTALFILSSPNKEKPPTTATVTPWVGFGSAGLTGTW